MIKFNWRLMIRGYRWFGWWYVTPCDDHFYFQESMACAECRKGSWILHGTAGHWTLIQKLNNKQEILDRRRAGGVWV